MPEKAIPDLHCDCRHGFLCQVFGRKKITMYSPDQEDFVYPHRAFNTTAPAGPDQTDRITEVPAFQAGKAH